MFKYLTLCGALYQAPRPTTAVKSGNSASTAQGKKAVPTVTFGPGGFAAQSRRQKAEDDYMGLVRKPTIGSEDSYTPSWPTNEIIPPMLIGKSKQSGDDKSDALLRRPTVSEMSPLGASSGIVDTSRQGGAKVPSVAAKPVFGKRIKNSHVKAPEVDVPSFDMSDERFARLLELAGTSDAEKDQVFLLCILFTTLCTFMIRPFGRLGFNGMLRAFNFHFNFHFNFYSATLLMMKLEGMMNSCHSPA